MLAELKPVLSLPTSRTVAAQFTSLPISNKSSSTHPELTHAVLEAP